jgi:hypothetical protein
MRKIKDIYEEYKIMPNLQMHQLRVAGVVSQLCDSLNLEVTKETLIITCLLHDMGNIIKSRLDYFPEFIKPEGLGYWQNVKDEFIQKYGEDEHEATVQIIKELGLPERVVNLAGENRFSYMCKHSEAEDLMQKLIHYADGRVGPHGILSYDERMNDANKRYKNHKLSVEEEERDRLVNCGREIEKYIFSHSNIKPEDINDESVAKIIEELKNFEI